MLLLIPKPEDYLAYLQLAGLNKKKRKEGNGEKKKPTYFVCFFM